MISKNRKVFFESSYRKNGMLFLVAWAVLIILGILEKRVYLHPDRMVFYHLPAAVCLVISFYHFGTPFRKMHQKRLRENTKFALPEKK